MHYVCMYDYVRFGENTHHKGTENEKEKERKKGVSYTLIYNMHIY